MGREIRRVPKDWQHPTNWRGHLQPMYDRVFDDALVEWLQELDAFKAGNDDRQHAEEEYGAAQVAASPAYYFSKYAGGPPDENYYRPAWLTEPNCYQMYETVSEGTPVSPVFETLGELTEWLVGQGYSRPAAEAFAKGGWAPSLAVVPGKGVFKGIEALTAIPKQ